MPTLRLMPMEGSVVGHGDEVLTCAFSPDSRLVLSGGWDGHLRLWDASSGQAVEKLKVSNKPVSACAVSPNGKQFLSGTLEGMLARWDSATYQEVSNFLAHTRPVSAIAFGNDDRTLVTASWDRNLILWKADHEGRTLSGHTDIVAGCRISPDGQWLVSWSHDHTVRLWEMARARAVTTFEGHNDRVLCGAVSPDGRWCASGARDHVLKLWDLAAQREAGTLPFQAEVRCCLFLLDGQSLLAGDANGQLGLYSVPDLALQGEPGMTLETGLAIQCGVLAPSGAQIALGCGDGCIHFVAVEGFDHAPLLITVIQSSRKTASALQRLFGKSSELITFLGSCPACRSIFEMPGPNPSATASPTVPCPGCRRQLRVSTVLPQGSEEY